ncbi:hypothetical protein [Nostoc linckia]|uniref:hypothetical protein n=1 Tax=Nostoc linckia TaxID=92942 RepID=UPI0015D519FC|nr:hypothetical protein [Nostoc linckia]
MSKEKPKKKPQKNNQWVGGKQVYGQPNPVDKNSDDDWLNGDFGFDQSNKPGGKTIE